MSLTKQHIERGIKYLSNHVFFLLFFCIDHIGLLCINLKGVDLYRQYRGLLCIDHIGGYSAQDLQY